MLQLCNENIFPGGEEVYNFGNKPVVYKYYIYGMSSKCAVHAYGKETLNSGHEFTLLIKNLSYNYKYIHVNCLFTLYPEIQCSLAVQQY